MVPHGIGPHEEEQIRTVLDLGEGGRHPAVALNRGDVEGHRWGRVAVFGDTVGTLAPRLTKGTEVYAESRLSLGRGQAATVNPAGPNLAAWEVQPMGQIGRRKPKAWSRDDGWAPLVVHRPVS